jgi:hypothetical protein
VCGLHFYQTLNRIRLDIIINDSVMRSAKEDQIFVPVPFCRRLMFVVARAIRVSRLDMANFPDDCAAVNYRLGAFGKGTSVA